MSSLSVHWQTVGNYYTGCCKVHFFQELLGDIEYNDIGEIIGAKAVGKQKQRHKNELTFIIIIPILIKPLIILIQ